MQLPLNIDKSSKVPLQQQIVGAMRTLITRGSLLPGSQIPSSRELSHQLSISRNTVILAYGLLATEGYIETKGKNGTFICSATPDKAIKAVPQPHSIPIAESWRARKIPAWEPDHFSLHQLQAERPNIDFRIGRAASTSFPQRKWSRLLTEKLAGLSERMTEYGDPAGLFELRAAVSDHLKTGRGINANPERIVIVGGCEEGLNIVARMLISPGLNVYVEDPCYRGASTVFKSYGATLTPIPVDDNGLSVDDLLHRDRGLVYVTPSHQFPMGVTLPFDRRKQLIEWASRTGAYIVEDDYDGDFRYDDSPLSALAGMDATDSVIYIGTFSKSIGSGLRIGYLYLPRDLVPAARAAKALLNSGNPWLEQAVVAEFLSSGGFAKHLRQIRQLYMHRRDVLIDQLRARFFDPEVRGHEGGMHLAWIVPNAFGSIDEIRARCLHRGVGVYSINFGPVHSVNPSESASRALLFGYPSLSAGNIVEGVAALDAAIRIRI